MPTAAPPPVTHVLYLHGFRSSAASIKARQTLAWLAEHAPQVQAWCPDLPPSPRAVLDMLGVGLCAWPTDEPERLGVIGSSLGGFYATVLAERLGCRAVLVNPAVDPARDLSAHIGPQTLWHDPQTAFDFSHADVAALRAMTPAAITQPQRYFGIFAQGDEVLDWREMAACYAGAALRIVPGSDHALSDYPQHLPWAMAALGLEQAEQTPAQLP